jgi:hypothetical protein
MEHIRTIEQFNKIKNNTNINNIILEPTQDEQVKNFIYEIPEHIKYLCINTKLDIIIKYPRRIEELRIIQYNLDNISFPIEVKFLKISTCDIRTVMKIKNIISLKKLELFLNFLNEPNYESIELPQTLEELTLGGVINDIDNLNKINFPINLKKLYLCVTNGCIPIIPPISKLPPNLEHLIINDIPLIQFVKPIVELKKENSEMRKELSELNNKLNTLINLVHNNSCTINL